MSPLRLLLVLLMLPESVLLRPLVPDRVRPPVWVVLQPLQLVRLMWLVPQVSLAPLVQVMLRLVPQP